MSSKTVLLILLFLGILCIVIGLMNAKHNRACKQQIIYRYIPRSFEQDQNEPIYVSDIFYAMFNSESPWVRSLNEHDQKRSEELNKYFISQS